MNVSYEFPILVLASLLTGSCTVEVADDVKRVDDEDVTRVMVDVEDDVEDVLKIELELEVVSSRLVDDVVNDDDDVDDVDVVVDELVDEVVDEVDEGALSLYGNQLKFMN